MVVVEKLSKLRRIRKLEYVACGSPRGRDKAVYYAILINLNRKVGFE